MLQKKIYLSSLNRYKISNILVVVIDEFLRIERKFGLGSEQ